MTDNNSFYIYVHLRATDGLPFYVGKGKGKRAWSSDRRNPYWKAVENKHWVITFIMYNNLTEEEAFNKEIQVIKDLREYSPDTMTNITDGGEGSCNKTKTEPSKQQIRNFRETEGRFPSVKIEEERILSYRLYGYCCPSNHQYDPEFHKEMKELGYGSYKGIGQDKKDKQNQVKHFYEQNGRFPSRCVPEEKRLYSWLRHSCSKAETTYDPEFHEWAKERGYGSGTGRNYGKWAGLKVRG